MQLSVTTLPQPDETTCGPTCLHAIYRYWGDNEPLAEVVGRLRPMEHGGTLAVFLGCDALRKYYCATIFTYNLLVFDPTWFAPNVDLSERLIRQREHKTDPRLQYATEGYLEFLELGGRLRFTNLSQHLIRGILRRKMPILTGLSSTYLYCSAREYGPDDISDDVRGLPAGHFVVIAGYDVARRQVMVVDPYRPNPYGSSHQYWVGVDRVVASVLLGIVTHDANLLVVYPRPKRVGASP